MGWNDHHPAIDPGDPDPGETMRGFADILRDSLDTVEEQPCRVCGEYMTRFGRTCRRCERNLQEEREDA